MIELTYREAVRETLRQELSRDERVVVVGECIEGPGTWGTTKGLSDEFPGRVRDTPISEAALLGMAMGAAMVGLRPVVEVMFGDFLTCCMDELVNQVAKARYMTGGQVKVPLVVRAACGLGKYSAAQHSQALEGWFMHVPGLKVAVPATPGDAVGLLRTAIWSDDPVLIFEYRRLYPIKGLVPTDPDFTIPLGQASVRREGNDVTVIATGRMVHLALEAADELGREHIGVEVIDPRSLVPLDGETMLRSVTKTNRALVVEEPTRIGGPGATIAAMISEECFYDLEAPVTRLASRDVPKPYSPPLERCSTPDVEDIVAAVRRLVNSTS